MTAKKHGVAMDLQPAVHGIPKQTHKLRKTFSIAAAEQGEQNETAEQGDAGVSERGKRSIV
jgi:hypothetical protein